MDSTDLLSLEASRAYHDFHYFRKYIANYSDFQEFHNAVDRVLLSPSRRKKILIPRNHLKSSDVIAWLAWTILRNTDVSILYETSVYKQTLKYTKELQGIILSDRWKRLYGDFKGRPWREEGGEFIINRRKRSQVAPTLTASGLDRTQTGQHYDIVVFDDIVDEHNHRTEEGREKAIERFRNATSLLRPGGMIVLIGTPWDEKDLYGWLEENPKIAAEFETIRMDIYFPGTRRIMFHQRFVETIEEEVPGKESLEYLRITNGPFKFACQYRCNPKAEDFAEFKESWLHYEDDQEILKRMLHPSTHGKSCLFVDPAVGKEHTLHPCDNGIVGAHFHPALPSTPSKADVFLAEGINIDPGSLIERIHAYAVSLRLDEVYIEDVQFQSVLLRLLELKRNQERQTYRIIPVNPQRFGDKDRRIRGLFPYYRFGQITHAASLKGSKLENQLKRFPKDRLKDVIDAFAQFPFMTPFPLVRMQKKDQLAKISGNAYSAHRAPKIVPKPKKGSTEDDIWNVGI
jgi:hypothetical protein